jgi:hypothetical protein
VPSRAAHVFCDDGRLVIGDKTADQQSRRECAIASQQRPLVGTKLLATARFQRTAIWEHVESGIRLHASTFGDMLSVVQGLIRRVD